MNGNHVYTILGKPITTTNSQRIVLIPTKKKEHRAPGEEITYRPMIMTSKAFATWKKNALPQFKAQRGTTPTIRCQCVVTIDIYRERNQGDVDNYAKGILDTMAKAGIIENDKLFKVCRAEKFTDKKNPRVVIEIAELPHDGLLFDLDDTEIPEEIETSNHTTIDDLPDAFLNPEELAERRARLVR